MFLFIDIETIPSQRPGAIEAVRTSLKPPSTLKKAESIAAWWRDEADSAAETAWRQQSLDGGLNGEICSIAICTDDEREWVRCRVLGGYEAELLNEAFAQVEAWTAADAKMLMPNNPDCYPIDDHHPVAHNAAFDFGFLWRRSIVLGVPTPRWLPGPMASIWRDNFTCTMVKWSGTGGRVSLDALCRALNIPSPKDGGLDGAGIFDAWMAGRYREIEIYNAADARAVREIYHRMMGWRSEAAA